MVAVHFWILAIGCALTVGPILLHLLMQQKPKRMPFPAMRFVREVQFKAKRSFRMRHWLLLLLRVLLPLLFAAALARPSAASAVFGSYWLLLLIFISASLFGFLAFYWWNKTGSNAGIPVEKNRSFGNKTILQNLREKTQQFSTSRLPIILLAGIFLAHLLAATWLISNVLRGPKATIALSGQDPVSAVVLVDTSPRTQYRHDNQSRLEKSKKLALWILDQLPAESQIAVLDSTDQIPGMSLDLSAARNQINNLEVTYLPVTVKKRIADSVQLLEESQWDGRELYVLSDMTEPSWNSKSGGSNILDSEGLSHSISTYLIDVGTKSFDNWSVSKWDLAAATITPGGTCSLKANISRSAGIANLLEVDRKEKVDEENTVPDPAPARHSQTETRTIRLFVEKPETGRPTFQNGKNLVATSHWKKATQVSLVAGQSQEVTLQIPNLPTGEHQGWIEIEGGDALPFDNRRFFSIRVEPARKVLIVNGPGVSETNFREAIDPLQYRQSGQSAFDCKVIPQSVMGEEALQSYRTVYLLDPKPLDAQQWRLLSTFVRRGGSLGIFLGHNAADSNDKTGKIDISFNSPEAQEILPGKLDDNPWRDPSGQMFLAPKAWDHPLFQPLGRYKDQLTWQLLPIFLHWGIDPGQFESLSMPKPTSTPQKNQANGSDRFGKKSSRILATFSNNQPSVIETQFGQGIVLTVTTPVTDPLEIPDRKSWNNFSQGERTAFTYWFWVNSLAEFLATANAGKINGMVGESFSLKNESGDAPSRYTLYRPNDAEPVEIKSQKGHLLSLFSRHPGNYRLKGINSEKKIFLKGYATNCPSGFSDLRRIQQSKIEDILGKDNFAVAVTKDQIIRKKGKGKLGLEFYPSLLRLLAVFFIAEMVFSNWFYRSDMTSKNAETESKGATR